MHLLRKKTKGVNMQGITVARPGQFKKLTSSRRTVSRAYGGVLTGTQVRERVMRAFLIDEFRVFKNMSKTTGDKKDKKKKKSDKKDKKASK